MEVRINKHGITKDIKKFDIIMMLHSGNVQFRINVEI